VLPQLDQSVFLSTLPAERGHRRWAGAAVLCSLALMLAFAPFAARPLPRSPVFLPLYESAIVVLYGITAALLLGQYVIQRAPSLLFLVGAYVYGGTMVVFHALSFPGMFAPGGLLGAGPQTTAWIYFSWHGGASLAMAGYGLAARRGGGAAWREMSDRAGVLSALAAVLLALAAATAAVLACTLGHDLLPRIMSGDTDRAGKRAVAIVTMATMALALPALAWKRRLAVLDLWLLVALAVWLCELVLEALLNEGRYTLGWYAGRVFGLIATGLLLVVLIVQDSRIHRRLLEMLALALAQRRQIERGERDLAATRQVASEARLSEAEARRAELELRRLAQARFESREEERRRLARDLHDDLGQTLAALKMELRRGAGEGGTQRALRIVDAAVASMRRIVADLRPTLLDDLGAVQAIEAYVQQFSELHGIACTLAVEPPEAQLPPACSTAVYRIVQEALGNVARHAGATHAQVRVSVEKAQVRVLVSDDGRGFDPAGRHRAGATGMAGMRERVLALGGGLVIDSAPGCGTRLEASIPLDAAVPEAP
jgi:two-component system, NarL family, sensor histidine kinase UhpB